MSVLGMSDLLAAMVALGGPTCTDARDHRAVHEALVWLAQSDAPLEGLPPLRLSPDPEVGTRVRGVTEALWTLAGSGFFIVDEEPGRASFRADPARLTAARRSLLRVGQRERVMVGQAAGVWAAASSMPRKKRRTAVSSSTAARRASFRNSLQFSESACRQRADMRTFPA